jgi:hypothetical protein
MKVVLEDRKGNRVRAFVDDPRFRHPLPALVRLPATWGKRYFTLEYDRGGTAVYIETNHMLTL